jgi:hypothetical protein
MRRVEVLKKDSMEEKFIFLEVEEEEEPKEVWLNVIRMEKKDTNLGNFPTEREKVEKHTLLKNINMWNKKQKKEEETS